MMSTICGSLTKQKILTGIGLRKKSLWNTKADLRYLLRNYWITCVDLSFAQKIFALLWGSYEQSIKYLLGDLFSAVCNRSVLCRHKDGESVILYMLYFFNYFFILFLPLGIFFPSLIIPNQIHYSTSIISCICTFPASASSFLFNSSL